MRRTALAAVMVIGCATGAPGWRDAELPSEVFFPGAGDDECSIPFFLDDLVEDLVTQACCLPHCAAYELGRETNAPEQHRFIADLGLAACLAYEGRPEWLVWLVYEGVRFGGWYSWHFPDRDSDSTGNVANDGRITDEAMPE